MAGWRRHAIGDIAVYQAATIAWLPTLIQGFTTRRGGVSVKPYDSLNLSLRVGDDPANVQTNRERLWADLGFQERDVALAEQVHGDRVGYVTQGGPPVTGVDALVTDTPGVLLMMLYADCVPIYIVEPVRRVVALVHAGWRGAAGSLPRKTLSFMQQQMGVLPANCLAAIGPCIGGDRYEVGSEVADLFRNLTGGANSGAATAVVPQDEFGGKYLLNLRQVVFTQLLSAGLRADHIAVSDADTYRDRREFYSYRRDGAASGRMAAFLGIQREDTNSGL